MASDGHRSGGATASQIASVEPVLRRVVGARVRNQADVDDLVQDALVQLLKAQARLAPEAVLPYAVVTARNLVISHARRSSRGLPARVVDARRPVQPDEAVLSQEERTALRAALAQLPEVERSTLVAHELEDRSANDIADADVAPGTVRVRLARSRAKLRVEYVLALRRLELPTPRCRPVLLALAGGDIARQRAVGAGDHLLVCPTCAELSTPLTQRDRGSLVLVPVALLRMAAGKVRAHPVVSAAGASAGAAAVVGIVALTGQQGPPVPPPVPTAVAAPVTAPVTAPPPAPPPRAIDGLSLSGQVVTLGPGGSLATLAGRTVAGDGVLVQSVVSHNGFWVGPDQTRRMWVELVGPLRNVQVVTGTRVSFSGRAVPGGPPEVADGSMAPPDVAQVRAEGVYLQVSTTALGTGG